MARLDKLERSLEGFFTRKVPVSLPRPVARSLAGSLWWLALVLGVLQLWVTWALWSAGHVNYIGGSTSPYGVMQVPVTLGFMFYVTVIVVLVSAVVALLAAPNLKPMYLSGWRFLYNAMLINALYGVARLFSGYGGLLNCLGALLGSAVGLYILFQIKEYFRKTHSRAPNGHPA